MVMSGERVARGDDKRDRPVNNLKGRHGAESGVVEDALPIGQRNTDSCSRDAYGRSVLRSMLALDCWHDAPGFQRSGDEVRARLRPRLADHNRTRYASASVVSLDSAAVVTMSKLPQIERYSSLSHHAPLGVADHSVVGQRPTRPRLPSSRS
jgi:hypothetical protein